MIGVKCFNCENRKKKLNETPCSSCDGNTFYKLANENIHFIPCYNCKNRSYTIDSAICKPCVNNSITNYPNYKLDTSIPEKINVPDTFGIGEFKIEGIE